MFSNPGNNRLDGSITLWRQSPLEAITCGELFCMLRTEFPTISDGTNDEKEVHSIPG